MTEKKYYPLLLSVLSGILLTAGWPVHGFPFLLFFGFIPLLMLEERFNTNLKFERRKIFSYSYLAFLIWNLGTTWWVVNASLAGAILAFVFNTLFMALVFTCFAITKRRLGPTTGYLSLIAYWIGFEFLHQTWQLSWPWLTLGNGFSEYYKLIQWYEFTGVFGGGVWILLSNILIYLYIKNRSTGNQPVTRKYFIGSVLLITLPIVCSLVRYQTYTEKKNPVSVAIIQPNIDPYNEKFSGMTPADQLNKILRLAASVGDTAIDYLVAPETALIEDHWENELTNASDIQLIRTFLKQMPQTKFVIGMNTGKQFQPGEPLSETARKFRDANGYYDLYNTAALIDTSKRIQVYHKSKLVPGVEQMPYPGLFKFVENFAIDLGGSSGSLATQSTRTVFNARNKIAPVICYESIYGGFLSEYVRNGADLIFIITNDGWWGDTPGYKQHLSYARLRAIETRRSIARSANTGISCFLNQRGDILKPTKWWTDDAERNLINSNSDITFYAAYSDWIAWVMVAISGACILLTIIKWRK